MHVLEDRIGNARNQLRKTCRDLDHAAALPEDVIAKIKAQAEDCAIHCSTVLAKLQTVRPLGSSPHP